MATHWKRDTGHDNPIEGGTDTGRRPQHTGTQYDYNNPRFNPMRASPCVIVVVVTNPFGHGQLTFMVIALNTKQLNL